MATITWIAGSAGNWNTGINWSGGVVPGASDDVVFDGTGLGNCTLDVNVSVLSITINSAYTGTLDAVTFNLTTSGNFTDSAGRILFGSGTWTIGGNLTLRGTSNTNCQSATINVTGNVPFNQQASNWIPGTSVWTVGGNVDAYNGKPASAYPNWSFTQTGTAKTAQFRNFANYTIASGANITNIRQLNCRFATINGSLNLSGKSLTSNYGLTVGSSGTIENSTGTGQVFFQGIPNYFADVILSLQGTFLNLDTWNFRTDLRNGRNTYRLQTATGLELPKFSFGASSTAGSDNWKLQIENDVIFAHDFLFFSDGSGSPGSLNNSTYNPNISFKRNVTFRIAGGMNYNVGTGTITFEGSSAQSADFNGETVEAIVVSDNSVNTITLADDVTTPYVHDCANQIDENGFTVTTTGTDPSPCSTGARYWVGLVDTDYENTGNWSTSSGGLGNASVPVGSNDVIFDGNGLVNCTMTNNRFANTLDVQSAYVNTFSLASFALSVVGNATADSNLSISTGTLSCQGDVDIYPLQSAGGTLTLNGTTQAFTLVAGSSINVVSDFNIDGSTVTTLNAGPSRNLATGAFVVNNGGSFTTGAGNLGLTSLSVGTGSFFVQTSNALYLKGGGGVLQNDGYIDVINLSHNNQHNGTYTWAAGDYRDTALTLEGNNETHTFGAGIVKLKSLTINASRSGRSATIANTTNNPNFQFHGNVNLNPTTGSVVWNAGDGTIILDNVISQSIDFNGQTVEGIHVTDASTGSIVLADNFSTAWLRDCDSLVDLNGYTITNADTEDRCAYPYDPPTTIALDSSAAINIDLEGWWHFLEGTGSTAADISASTNNLSHSYGEFVWKITEIGTVGNLTGTGLLSTSTVPTLTDKLTISQWLYYEGAIERETSFAGNTTNAGYAWALRTENVNDPMRFFVNGSFTESSQLPIDQWVHVVGVYDGTDIRLYIDGVQDGTPTSVTGNVNSFNNIFIGNQDADSSVFPFTGLVQNSRIWSRALSSSEVSSLYSDPWIGSDYTAVVPPSNRYFSPAAFRRLG